MSAEGGRPSSVKTFVIKAAPAASGDNTIITSAPADGDALKRIHVFWYQVELTGATTTTHFWKSSGAAGQLTGAIVLTQNGADTDRLSPTDGSLFYTDAGANLVLNLSGAFAHSVTVGYYYDQRPLN